MTLALGCGGDLTSEVRNDPDGSSSHDAGDAGTLDAGDPVTGDDGGGPIDPPPGSIPLFVAQGHAGRTMISCDDGHTWVANRSDNDSLVCFTGDLDCDHHSGAGQGITYGAEYFFATYGWGTPGSVRRSQDGVSWETVLEGTGFSGLAFGNQRLVAGTHTPKHSDDLGQTWADGSSSDLSEWVTRRIGFVPTHGGRFILISDGVDIVVSNDGATWWHPATMPADCGGSIQTQGGIAYGNGVAVIAGGNGVACRSTDGGNTWTSTRFADSAESELVWTGNEFLLWGQGVRYRSTDGATWTTTATNPPGLRIGAVASSDEGTIVAVRGGWQVWYDEQEMYRSTDGITWQTLASNAFVGSHPIRHIVFGHGKTSAACPSQ